MNDQIIKNNAVTLLAQIYIDGYLDMPVEKSLERILAFGNALQVEAYEDASRIAYNFRKNDLDPRGSWRENISAAIRNKTRERASERSN